MYHGIENRISKAAGSHREKRIHPVGLVERMGRKEGTGKKSIVYDGI